MEKGERLQIGESLQHSRIELKFQGIPSIKRGEIVGKYVFIDVGVMGIAYNEFPLISILRGELLDAKGNPWIRHTIEKFRPFIF